VNPDAWRLHGRSLWDYFSGDAEATLILHSDLLETEDVPVRAWFRQPAELGPHERRAVALCRGRVLDAGAGTGVHSLVLQERGLEVVAIDVVPEAVEIMRRRGVRDVRLADLMEPAALAGETFDTILMLANGAGLTENLAGLDHFLREVDGLLRAGGQILMDSTDLRPPSTRRTGVAPRSSKARRRLAGRSKRPDERYLGEIQFQLEYRGEKGAPFPQLYVDPDTLIERAAAADWACEMAASGEGGAYLARLTRGARA
jgi:SAM-dependent methyltransferase